MPMSERQLDSTPPTDPSRVPDFDRMIAETDEGGDNTGGEGRTEPIRRGDEDNDTGRGVGDVPTGDDGEETRVVEPSEDEKREARGMGWVDKRAFRGDPNNWVDAKTFLKRGREVLPIVKSQLERVNEENRGLKREIEEIKEAAKSYTAFVDEQKTAQKNFEMNSLKSARAEALRADDFDRVNEIDLRLQELRAPAPEPKKANGSGGGLDPEVKRLWEENIRVHPFLAEKAAQEDWSAEAMALRMAGNKDTGQGFVNRVNDRMRRIYPERFDGKRRAAMVDGDGTPAPNGGGNDSRSWDNLLPAYRREYEKSGKRLGVSKKEFLSQCDASCFER